MAHEEPRGRFEDADQRDDVRREERDEPEPLVLDPVERRVDTPRAEPTAASLAGIFGELLHTSRVFRLVRLIYLHNPFYLVSAALALLGLNAALGTSAETADAWVVLGVLAGYTTLMAVTAFVIVRFGRLWSDARSILVILVVLFIAMSVSFDEIINREAVERGGMVGVSIMCCGMALAVLLSEGLLRGLRIRLRPLFRMAYYAVLALFFGYPVFLRCLLPLTDEETVLMGIAAFPLVAAAAFLTLLPAARRASAYTRDNGTPWRWPWFPWVPFVILWLGAGVRSYYLTLSFHGVAGMDSIFGAYFLVPLVFAAAVVMLETGIASRRRWLQPVALALPLLSIAMAFPGAAKQPGPYAEFMQVFLVAFGSPALITALGAVAFYIYAGVRRCQFAIAGLVLALAALSVIGGATVDLSTLRPPRWSPLVLAAVIQAVLAFRTRRSGHALVAVALVVFASLGQLPAGSWDTRHALIPSTIAYVGALALGLLFRDRLARLIASCATLGHVPALILALVHWEWLAAATWGVGPWVAAASTLVVPALFGWLTRRELGLYVALGDLGILTVYGGAGLYHALHSTYGDRMVVPIFWSGASFVVAVIISLIKTEGMIRGVARRILALYRPPPGHNPGAQIG